jgi:phosphoribosylanthranilate isomerase
MSVAIKMCGITRLQDAQDAVSCGAAILGLNFYSGSPRCITLEAAQQIAASVAGRVKLAGVFVNMNLSEVLRIARAVRLDVVQLHGSEPLAECQAIAAEFEVIRAFKVDAAFNLADAARFAALGGRRGGTLGGILLDTPCEGHGGSGVSFSWTQINWHTMRRLIAPAKLYLAGGLTAENVGEAIAQVQPDVVDVCSGIEFKRGIKSLDKMRDFEAAVRAAERQQV